MQINQNEGLKTKQVNRIEPVEILLRNADRLKSGDFIMASVEQKLGDMIQLRMAGGVLLNAAMNGDINLQLGDVIEAAVSKDGEECLLRILNVSSEGSQHAASGGEKTIPPNLLMDMLPILKRNPGMDADTAHFLAENNIMDTPENLETLKQLAGKDGIGKLMGQVLDLFIKEEAVQTTGNAKENVDKTPIQQKAAVPEDLAESSRQPEKGKAQVPQSNTTSVETHSLEKAADKPSANAAETKVGDINTSDIAQTDDINIVSKAANKEDTLIQEPQAKSLDVLKSDAKDNTNAKAAESSMQSKGAELDLEHAPASVGEEPDIADKDTVKQKNRIPDIIKELVFKKEEITGEKTKRSITEMSEFIKMLKSELNKSDNKNKALCIKGVDQAMRQLELAEKTVQFEYLQLPFINGDGEYQTTELFIFQQRGGQKSKDDSNVSILIALDTKNSGHVETMIRVEGGSISIEFRLEQLEMADEYKRNSMELADAVEAAGYKLRDIRYAELEKRTTIINAGKTVLPDTLEARQGIDVHI